PAGVPRGAGELPPPPAWSFEGVGHAARGVGRLDQDPDHDRARPPGGVAWLGLAMLQGLSPKMALLLARKMSDRSRKEREERARPAVAGSLTRSKQPGRCAAKRHDAPHDFPLVHAYVSTMEVSNMA